MKYLKREVAKQCPAHQAVMEVAANHLMEHGYFAKEDVIKESGMYAVSEALRWDYIAEFLKEDQDCDLIPLSPKFWNMTTEERVAKPGSALAGGHGAKTAGYALVGICEGALAVRKLMQRRQMANGTGIAFRHFADSLVERDLLDGPDVKLLEGVNN